MLIWLLCCPRTLRIKLLKVKRKGQVIKFSNHTHGIFAQTDFCLDKHHDILCSCGRMKLHGMILAIHKMKSSVYWSSIDCVHNFLSAGRPLSLSSTLCFIQALFRESRVLTLFSYEITSASLQMRD
jgi:hypothetical protein